MMAKEPEFKNSQRNDEKERFDNFKTLNVPLEPVSFKTLKKASNPRSITKMLKINGENSLCQSNISNGIQR